MRKSIKELRLELDSLGTIASIRGLVAHYQEQRSTCWQAKNALIGTANDEAWAFQNTTINDLDTRIDDCLRQIGKIHRLRAEIDELEAEREEQEAKEHEGKILALVEAQKQRDHEEKMAKLEIMKIEQQRLAAEAARDAAKFAKIQENEQFMQLLKSLKEE